MAKSRLFRVSGKKKPARVLQALEKKSGL